MGKRRGEIGMGRIYQVFSLASKLNPFARKVLKKK
jgi:hypothetical protein